MGHARCRPPADSADTGVIRAACHGRTHAEVAEVAKIIGPDEGGFCGLDVQLLDSCSNYQRNLTGTIHAP
jgi:hypothetical protein